MRYILLLSALFFCCSDSQDNFINELPEKLKIEGTAASISDTLNINCIFEFTSSEVKQKNETKYIDFSGLAGRSALLPDGSGIALEGLAAGSFKVELSDIGEIVLRDTLHTQNTPPGFWDELLLLEGELIDDQHWRGTWSCNPFYTRGDSIGVINGIWNMYEVE